MTHVVTDSGIRCKSTDGVDLNQRLAAPWPVITKSKGPLPDADRWKGEKGKLATFEF